MMATETPTLDAALDALYECRSKHSAYQQVHPRVRPLLAGPVDAGLGKLEPQRARLFAAVLPLRGARVLDIGANTGYFGFAALEAGAAQVTCVEGNAEHARFMRDAASQLGLQERVQVESRYFAFGDDALAGPYDVGLCLNVLHHLGDDFGDRALTLDAARHRIAQCLDALATRVRVLALQIGFNWKGDRTRPLFAGGEKRALAAFVEQAAAAGWVIEGTWVADPATREFVPLGTELLPRNDTVGEFMNRPLFVLHSRRLGGA
jgi:SAM-dependent methyltransferase